jgi:hypothetical protein
VFGIKCGGDFLALILPAPMEVEFEEVRPLFEEATLLETEYWFRPDEELCLECVGSLAGTCKW